MYKTLICLAVINVTLVLSRNTPPPHKFSCKPGETRVVEIGCWGYDKCENGRPVTHYCTGGRVFERDSMSCVISGHTSCNLARDCTKKKDGDYADMEDNCETFYRCYGGKFFGHFYCPANLVFNEAHQYCDHPQNVPSCKPKPMLNVSDSVAPPPPKFSCKPGETRVVEIGCWGYAKCDNGDPVTHYCRRGMVFERDSMSCVVSGHTSCGVARDCSNKGDRFYADMEDNCETFYRCAGGKFHGRFYCPGDLVFNEAEQHCDLAKNVPTCNEPPKPETTLTPLPPHPFSCKPGETRVVEIGCWGYDKCENGRPVTHYCTDGKVFERDSMSCVVSGHTSCGVNSDCTNKRNQFYADTDDSCETFYRCYNGRFFGRWYCPADLVFSQDNQRCDHPQNVRCGKSNTLFVESEKMQYKPKESINTPAPHIFSCKPGETRVVEIGCWGYDKCENGNPVTHYCTGGKVFERDSMSCVVSGHTSCGKTPDCTNKPNQFYADSDDSCETFYSCFNGRFVGRYYCPADLVFNQNHQWCDHPQNVRCGKSNTMLVESVKTPPPYKSMESLYTPPPHKFSCKPGETRVVEIGCWGYDKCENGNPVTHYCTGGKVFERDSMSCVVSGHTSCNLARDCSNKANGMYADMEDNCETYYRCDGGRFLGHFYCPANLVFNEEKQLCDFDYNVPACLPKTPFF